MPASIGQQLKDARESRRLTLDQASAATHIRAPYLQALENDDYSVMGSAAQGRGFLRIYANFLGLNLEEITAGMREKPDATPARVLETPTAPIPPAEPAPASTPEPKLARPGFWSRLLRRTPPAESETGEKAPEASEPTVGTLTPAAEEPSPAPVTVEEAEAEIPVKPARKTSAAKKSTRPKNPAAESATKSARKTTPGKKKQSLSRQPKR